MFGKDKIPSINANELKQKLDANENITLLDVRKPNEWMQTGIIPGSVMISMQDLPVKLQNGLDLKNKEPIVVICKTGSRSNKVTEFLVNHMGINATNLSGGVVGWYRIGGEFEKI